MGSHLNGASWRVALMINNSIRRYGIEGMLRLLVGGASVMHLDISSQGADHQYGGQQFDVLLAASADLCSDQVRHAIRGLCATGPRLLILADGPDTLELPWISTCGACGFLDWSEIEPGDVMDAVADVMAGKFYVSPKLARRLVVRVGQAAGQSGPPGEQMTPTLTPRELQVLRLLAEGLSNKEVSRQLLISEHGVKRLVGNVLAKLNCPNRTLAVVRAMEGGLLAV